MKNYLFSLGLAVGCFSCSSTNLMSLSVMQPAPVTLPPNARTAAVVNRTRVSDENKVIDVLHKAVSLETNGLQKDGARASMSALADELLKNNRFTVVKPLNNLDLRSYGAGVFPSPLPWDTVRKICSDNNADLLFSLELFDAESKLAGSLVPTNINNIMENIGARQSPLGMNTLVRTGWRIYDPASRNILDEYVLSKEVTFSGGAANPIAAADALMGRKEAVRQMGAKAGQAYACRIIPYWLRVSRFYFVRGDGNFSVATRMARTGNWDGAAKLWQQETSSASRKIAGRACYNMAIISEINGDLSGAMQWAQKAYEMYNVRLALSYVNVLRSRENDNAVLKAQNEVSATP